VAPPGEAVIHSIQGALIALGTIGKAKVVTDVNARPRGTMKSAKWVA